MSSFPRNSYPLPGIDGLWSVVAVIVQTLFFSPPEDSTGILANAMWRLERHEWEFGTSVAPLLLIASAAATGAVVLFRRRSRARIRIDRVTAIAALAVLLAIPALLNWYEPHWNALLKAFPYFGNASNLVRFFSAYIPVVVVAAALALDRLPIPAFAKSYGRLTLAVGGVAILLAQTLATDRTFYASQGYAIAPIETAYASARGTGVVPAIDAIGTPADTAPNGPNDAMVKGRSQLYCYQPLFGYRLENFPVAPLQPGRVITAIGQVINLKNPACYLFPAENGCRPGQHFTIDQVEDAVAFLTYRPFAFVQSARQEQAAWLSLLSLASMGAALLAAAVWALLARTRKAPAGADPVTPP